MNRTVIKVFLERAALLGLLSLGVGACAVGEEESCVSDAAQFEAFELSGNITFGSVPAVLDGWTPKLDYAATSNKPARRIVVQAVDNCDRAVAETTSDDYGFFKLSVPGNEVRVKAVSHVYTANFANHPSGAGTAYETSCTSAAWDFRVVDNTEGQAFYSYRSTDSFTASSANADLDIPLGYDLAAQRYTDRSAAAFALADTVVSSLEKVCEAAPTTRFPKLMINWSARNYSAWGNKASGAIGTSHFTVEASTPQLYILGKENVDTDEYDSHVVAHEFGHYLEYSIYRSDTIGGSHSVTHRLDPRVAFGEGYGNAFSAIVTEKADYIDSMSSGQVGGITIDIAQSTRNTSHNGIHVEKSVQYLLYKLYQDDGNHFAKIHEVLKNYQSVSPAFTTALTFAAHYNARFGDSLLRPLWETELDTPYDALCVAASCVGSGTESGDVADPFDSKQLIGAHYASGGRTYDGSTQNADFWNLYRPLSSGTNSATAHEIINDGGYSYPYNKFGYVRWYTYTHTGSSRSVSISVPSLSGGVSCSSRDWLDMYVYGTTGSNQVVDLLTYDERTTGCPSVSFFAETGKIYLITVNGVLSSGGNLSGYQVRVNN